MMYSPAAPNVNRIVLNLIPQQKRDAEPMLI